LGKSVRNTHKLKGRNPKEEKVEDERQKEVINGKRSQLQREGIKIKHKLCLKSRKNP
jgi:hypothetical protein